MNPPFHFGSIPDQAAHLMRTVNQYEQLAVVAILHCSTRHAIKALMAHPMLFSFTRASKLVDEYLKANAACV